MKPSSKISTDNNTYTLQQFDKKDLLAQENRATQLKIFKTLLEKQFNNGEVFYKYEQLNKVFQQVYAIKLPNLKSGMLALTMSLRGKQFLLDMAKFQNRPMDSYKASRKSSISSLRTTLDSFQQKRSGNIIGQIYQNMINLLKQNLICSGAVYGHFSTNQANHILYQNILLNSVQTQKIKKLNISLVDKQFIQNKITKRIVRLKQRSIVPEISGQKRYFHVYLYPFDNTEQINNSWILLVHAKRPQIKINLQSEQWFMENDFIKRKSMIQAEQEWTPSRYFQHQQEKMVQRIIPKNYSSQQEQQQQLKYKNIKETNETDRTPTKQTSPTPKKNSPTKQSSPIKTLQQNRQTQLPSNINTPTSSSQSQSENKSSYIPIQNFKKSGIDGFGVILIGAVIGFFVMNVSNLYEQFSQIAKGLIL